MRFYAWYLVRYQERGVYRLYAVGRDSDPVLFLGLAFSDRQSADKAIKAFGRLKAGTEVSYPEALVVKTPQGVLRRIPSYIHLNMDPSSQEAADSIPVALPASTPEEVNVAH